MTNKQNQSSIPAYDIEAALSSFVANAKTALTNKTQSESSTETLHSQALNIMVNSNGTAELRLSQLVKKEFPLFSNALAKSAVSKAITIYNFMVNGGSVQLSEKQGNAIINLSVIANTAAPLPCKVSTIYSKVNALVTGAKSANGSESESTADSITEEQALKAYGTAHHATVNTLRKMKDLAPSTYESFVNQGKIIIQENERIKQLAKQSDKLNEVRKVLATLSDSELQDVINAELQARDCDINVKEEKAA